MTEIFIWLGVLVFFLIVEGITVQLVSVWFALGALAACVAAAFGAPLWLQIVLFVVVSAAALVITRPLVKKFVNGRKEATNADMVIGRTGIVTVGIDNLARTGQVKMESAVWSARTADGTSLPAGTTVKAVRIEGVKLIVEPV